LPENISSQLIYFANLIENQKGANTHTDIEILQQLIKEFNKKDMN